MHYLFNSFMLSTINFTTLFVLISFLFEFLSSSVKSTKYLFKSGTMDIESSGYPGFRLILGVSII